MTKLQQSPETQLLQRELPIESEHRAASFASDAIAELLRDIGVEHIAMNPGSSYRGLHDSLVNHLGNRAPQMLLCLHEEHAVALAHGFAKVADRPMAVAIHSNVGLMHASMAIFNAFCDRTPILLLGATGPLDAEARRPWIDWLHTATDQAALVRPFVKWDDQPTSATAALAAVLQAHMLTSSVPKAPTYVCFDAAMLERPLSSAPPSPRPGGFAPAVAPQPPEETIAELAARLASSERPVLLIGRTSRSPVAWEQRVELAERIGATVFTHLKLPAAFPTRHPLHSAPPQTFISKELGDALASADTLLSLDWLDLGGTLETVGEIAATTISVSLDDQLHGGWGKDSFSPAPVDLRISADVDATVSALLRHLPAAPGRSGAQLRSGARVAADPQGSQDGPVGIRDLAVALDEAIGADPITLVRVPNSWSGDLWESDGPLDMLGGDGGEGIGSGIGMTVGAALALRDSDRLAVSVLGDGDFLMGVNGLWTAAHYGLPLLIVVANNSSFFNDEIHQHRVAEMRGRPVENRWIGQRISDPDPDLAGLARAQGLLAHGPVRARSELRETLALAVEQARGGNAVVVDVHVPSDVQDSSARAATQTERGH